MRRVVAVLLLAAVGACDRPQAPASPDEETVEQLSALGYVSGTDPAGAATGVSIYERDRVSAGWNFFTSGHAPVAMLMDMDGEVVHEWRAGFRDLFPDHPLVRDEEEPRRNFWRVARLLPNGDVIAIWDLYGIFKLDRDSKILWVVPEQAHHDLHVTADGRIHHLEAERRWLPGIPERKAIDDFLVVRDENGEELSRLAISSALGSADWLELRRGFWVRALARGYGLRERSRFDPFHTNALRILADDDARRLGDPFQVGDALVSMGTLDTIAVLDTAEGTTRWWQQGPFGMQHDPRVTPGGEIVVFNNFREKERSSVQIIDPHTHRVTWEYTGTESRPLFSRRSGGARVLPNGNVLIIETDRGRVIEVTRDLEIVWEYRTPFLVGGQGGRVAHVHSVERIREEGLQWFSR